MPNALRSIVAIFLAVIIMYFGPLYYMAAKADENAQNYIEYATADFVNTIKNSGCITERTYSDFIKEIDRTNNLYNIEIEHQHKVVDPIYDEETGVFQNTYRTNYYSTYQDDILNEIFDGSGKYSMNKDDIISVRVSNRNKSFASKLQQIIYHREMPVVSIVANYGGVIRDEIE